MKPTRALGLLIALFSACTAGPELETRTFELKYVDASDARDLIRPYVYDRPSQPGTVSEGSGPAISVRETRDNLDQIERMLAQFDRPPRAIRLFFQLIEADGAQPADPAIADVEAELRKVFRFEGYRLMSEATMTALGGAGLEQRLFDQEPKRGGWVSFDLRGVLGRPQGPGDSTQVSLEIRLHPSGQPALFSAQVMVPLGKTMVLGTTRLPSGMGIILTVRAEIAE